MVHVRISFLFLEETTGGHPTLALDAAKDVIHNGLS